jgi:NAD(P)H-nitrite reductase large subunit
MGIDVKARHVTLRDGRSAPFDKLLLATGAEPVRLEIPGADQPHVHVLRSLADSRAIIASARQAKRAVVLGASFIGLEVAASLRARGIEVHVVAPGSRPLERILGREFGDFIRGIHEEHGVIFHPGQTATAIDRETVTLKNGATLAADLVVVGIGVRPRIELAERAGLKVDRGIAVNQYLETSAPGIFAAGDVARCFWSQHYDVPINYVGHADKWDDLKIDGDIKSRDCLARYRRSGKVVAVASIFRDIENLKEELAMEHPT